ncbi:hypothetical protein FRUB_07763 [Fimbriiglobus ruber]|uniref:Uncharacterized protein n=1 Tax=Fimbriiglobus ruber TaxID=1908690 RepID=A0A225DCD0_9BACT|nr:hypothetical protein FRUB_07763 [Fimbriiglobus ruber]
MAEPPGTRNRPEALRDPTRHDRADREKSPPAGVANAP